MATIDSSGQNLSDEQNLLNEVHLVIAFIGNPTWIKEREEGTYLLQSACQQLSLQFCGIKILKCRQPDFRRPPPDQDGVLRRLILIRCPVRPYRGCQ